MSKEKLPSGEDGGQDITLGVQKFSVGEKGIPDETYWSGWLEIIGLL